MEIILTYKGHIPAKTSNKKAIWNMRKSFHNQLIKIWDKQPFQILSEWYKSEQHASSFENFHEKFIKKHDGVTFIPIYGRTIGIGVSLDITLLTGMEEKNKVLKAGDLDNRIKRIIDGLRVPIQKGELCNDLANNSEWHCLLEDDDAVISLNAQMGTYLGSDDSKESFAFIRVKPMSTGPVYTSTLSMLF